MSVATVESVTTVWRLDPPVVCERDYQREGTPIRMVEIHLVERTTRPASDRDDHWSVKGVPLTSKGNPNGGIDWRHVPDEAMDMLRRMVEG